MKLVGALSSPYTRRVAISLSELGVPFEHESVSVFAELNKFRGINPVVRALTVFLDDGAMVMESNVIIEYCERTAGERSLWPRDEFARRRGTALLGLALTACDKAVQLVYERELRPAEKQFKDWQDRVSAQVAAACELLEQQVGAASLWLSRDRLTQAGIALAVVCTFMQFRVPDVLARCTLPKLFAFRDEAEALPVFRRLPFPAVPAAPASTATFTLWS
jgi:glutathione S-transferase